MVQIDELLIRVPGMTPEAGSLLGSEVAQLVAAGLPDSMESLQIPELNIRMMVSQSNDSMHLAASIAEQIIRQLNQALL